MYGGEGDDLIWGHDGADKYNGGPGNDIMYGGDLVVDGSYFNANTKFGTDDILLYELAADKNLSDWIYLCGIEDDDYSHPTWEGSVMGKAYVITVTVEGVVNGKIRLFQPFAGDGALGYSKMNIKTLDATVPECASSTLGLTAEAGDTTIALSWIDPSDSTITMYQYRVSDDGAAIWGSGWTGIANSARAPPPTI